MRAKITVIGESAIDLVTALRQGDRADVVHVADGGSPDLAGSDVVVVAQGADVVRAARGAARRAWAAVILVATGDPEGDCAGVLEVSLLPRARVLGVAASDVVALAEAVLFDRETVLRAAVLCRGEAGVDGRVATVPVHVAWGGVHAIGA